jgi:acyl-CoA reductase-like NAD-dependent aldehyde dehydrogenase
MSDSLQITVGGMDVAATATFEVVNPATGKTFAHAPSADRELIDFAVTNSADAFETWRIDEEVRRQCLRDAAAAVNDAAEDLATLIASERGALLSFARQEVQTAVAWLRYYAKLEIPRDILQDDAFGFTEIVRDPLGVVAAIAPWNYPLGLAVWKIAPALRAGNTVVLKPSPYTPLSSLLLGRVVQRVFPPGVLNVVSGVDAIGPWVTGHWAVRKVSFTGSIETGKRVAAAAVSDLKRVTLELGGNDAALVLDDADVDKIADDLFWGAFTNAGQICFAIKRVYAPAKLYDEIVAALADRARMVVVGDPFDPATTMGPVANKVQLEWVSALVTDAVDNGGVVASGGSRLDRAGYFYSPTVLSGVDDGFRVVDEEQFGPVLPIVRYTDVADAVQRANASRCGLTATVWTSDPERADPIARQLDCGKVSINTHVGGIGPNLPFGGHKWSGLGVENGPWGLHEYTDIKVVHRKK